MTAKYGNRNVPKMIREWDAHRQACRAEGTPLIQSTLDAMEEHIDFAYRAIPATDAREKALREAAAVASKLAAQWWSEYKNVGHEKAYSTHHEGMSDGAVEVAAAILRALEEEGRDG